MFIFLFITVILFVQQTVSLQCSQRSDCIPITTNYNYADCVSGQCQCLTSLGFDGNATASNKCFCKAPSSIYYLQGVPHCFQYSDAVACKVEKAKNAYQIATVQAVYQSLIWPTPALIMQALISGQESSISLLFSDDAEGRVDPAGKFLGHEGIVEYFYGTVWTGSSKVIAINFKTLMSDGNRVVMRVDLTFESYDPQSGAPIGVKNLTQSGSFTFNDAGKIRSVDLIIHNLGAHSDAVTPYGPQSIGTLCYIVMTVAGCNSTHDPDGYYTDMNDCIHHMANVYPWGSWSNLFFNGNSSLCRYFHSLLAIARPHVHCSHSGRTGGGKCIDHVYESYYEHDF